MADLQKQAKAIVAMGLITKTETGYEIARPAFRGVPMGEPFVVENGKCSCISFEETGECPHALAVEAVEAEAAARIPATEYDLDRLREAARQAYAEKSMFAQDEREGAAWYNAFYKAETEIYENKTIRFGGGVLTLRSRGTGISYEITEAGCGAKCKAQVAATPCYHRAIYAILSNYYASAPQIHPVPQAYSPRFSSPVNLGLAA